MGETGEKAKEREMGSDSVRVGEGVKETGGFVGETGRCGHATQDHPPQGMGSMVQRRRQTFYQHEHSTIMDRNRLSSYHGLLFYVLFKHKLHITRVNSQH